MERIRRGALLLATAVVLASAPVGAQLTRGGPVLAAGCDTVIVNPASPSPTGTSVLITANNPAACTPFPIFRFWIRNPGGPWTVVQDYSETNTYNWTATGQAGTYGIEVDFKDRFYDMPRSYGFPVVLSHTLEACSGATLVANPASPQVPSVIQFTATATCPGTPSYRFWVRAPGRPWQIVQDYSPTATFSWDATGQAPGSFNLEVDVRNQDAAASYEAVARVAYIILPPTLAPTPCSTAGLGVNPASPQGTGASITLTGSSSGCAAPVYRFWIAPPGSGWSVVRDYSATNTFNWTAPATGSAGTYRLEVDVRDQGESLAYDAVANSAYRLDPCSAAAIGANPASPHYPAGTVVLTGTATCPGTATYRFWVRPPGAAWSLVQDFRTTNTFGWNTSGLTVGSYGLEVDVRDQGATASYEKVANSTYVLQATPCATAGLNASTTSPAATGSTITFTATTSACTTPIYRFWAKRQGAEWDIEQDYSTSNSWSWAPPITGQAGDFEIEVDVRDQAETTAYDAVKNMPFQLVACSAATLSAAPPSPSTHGSNVGLTATATCPGTPEFQFWANSGSVWNPVTNYTPSNTLTVNTSAAGTWQYQVTVRNQGATDAVEAFAQITYMFT